MKNIFDIQKKYGLELLVLILLGLMYFKSAILWGREWVNFDSFYSYGLFMPVFLFYFIKRNKEQLINLKIEPSMCGFCVLILGCLVYFVGEKINYQIFIDSSFPIVLSGLILSFYGKKQFLACLWPLLILSISLPILPIIRLTIPLQLFFSAVTSSFLHFLGVTTQQVGSVLYMNGTAVSIEPGCAGLKSLLNLTALAFMYSYFIKSSILKKSLFVALSIFISLISNMFRISFSGFYLIFNGHKGFEQFHYALGLIFYIIGIFLLLFIANNIEEPACE